MPLLLVVAFIVVPLVEIYVLIQVGQLIGVLPTVLLLLADSVLGAALVRHEGRRTWGAFRAALSAGRVPAKEVADGALVVFGGALLLTPGFTTDVLGLLCILPPTRAFLRRRMTGVVTRRLGVPGVAGLGRRRRPPAYGVPGTGPDRRAEPGAAGREGRGPGATGGHPGAGRVVDGEIVEDP